MSAGTRRVVLALVGFVLVLSACAPATGAVAAPDMHTSRNSLDWDGVYEGVQPCAGCPEIGTRLALNRDGTYALTTWPLSRADPAVSVSGKFTWMPAGNAIALDASGGERRWFVGEGRLVQAASDGTPDRKASAGALTQLPRGVRASVTEILGAYRWRLDTATDAANRRIDVMPQATARPPVFGFSAGRISIEGSCNRLNGSFAISAEARMSIGRVASTMKACDPASMQADRTLTDLLAKPLRVDLVRGLQPRLRLVTDLDQTLAFTGEPTPETRYGAGTTMFLEVAAERIPCNRPLMAASTCLQVRERRFDAQGLAMGPPGDWRPMYEDIEGYTHREGERNVVRVKRYTRSPAPADASSFVYVLDLVVETEIVRR